MDDFRLLRVVDHEVMTVSELGDSCCCCCVAELLEAAVTRGGTTGLVLTADVNLFWWAVLRFAFSVADGTALAVVPTAFRNDEVLAMELLQSSPLPILNSESFCEFDMQPATVTMSSENSDAHICNGSRRTFCCSVLFRIV